jgi:uncharacterized membrane protein (DUF4010 family)
LVLLSAVILPLLPTENINQWVPVSPFKIWLAVVVSSVSYLGYISQKYVVKEQGLMLTGLLGGLYSSTATTVVLARKSKDDPRLSYKMTAAILAATGLMYVRLWVIAALFMWSVALTLLPYMAAFAVVFFLISMVYLQLEQRHASNKPIQSTEIQNPLELKVAFVFAGMFIFMAVVTQLVMTYFGDSEVRYLSLVVGFTDIDPFVLSVLNGDFAVNEMVVASAILIATGSNNL